jgi:hypothetical protein
VTNDTRNPQDVVCSKCNASVGQPCTATLGDRTLTKFHRERMKAPKVKDESKWTSYDDERGIQYRKIKVRRGQVKTQYRARVIVKVNGERLELTRMARTRSDAHDAKAALLREAKEPAKVEVPLPPQPKSETITFAELADEYERAKIKATIYDNPDSDNRTKIGGIAAKSVQDAKRTLTLFKVAFKDKLAKDITKQEVTNGKEDRFNVPKQRGGGRRSVTNVNHELRVLRSLFSYAMDQYGFAKNPVIWTAE